MPDAREWGLPLMEWGSCREPKTTTPVKCLLCDTEAVVIVYCPQGCTCSPNRFQPRCYHHLMRLYDSDEGRFVIVEDFIIGKVKPVKDGVLRRWQPM